MGEFESFEKGANKITKQSFRLKLLHTVIKIKIFQLSGTFL
jgi:hypothetical protein